MKPRESEKNKIASSKITTIERGNSIYAEGSFMSQIKIPDSVYNSLNTVNAISESLSVVIPNTKLFDSYNNALQIQKSALENIKCIDDKFIGKCGNFNNVVSNIIASASVPVAEIGLTMANATRLFDSGIISEGNFTTIGKVSDFCLDAMQIQHESLVSGFSKINESVSVINKTIDNSIWPFRAVSSGIDQMMRATELFPLINLPDLQIVRDETSVSEEDYRESLDNRLEEISSELVSCRRGCWKTFNAKREDYIRQASSSMRGLIDTLLRIIAPVKEVEKTNYFKNNSEAKTKDGRPTRKAKIYYAVNFDEKRAVSLERIVKAIDGLLELHKNLSAWDHAPINNDQFVRGNFVAIEGLLFSILTETKK